MGPPFFDGGNSTTAPSRSINGKALQWGRRFLTAETSSSRRNDGSGGQASMGPPFFDGGNQPGHFRHKQIINASMGPPFFDGGNASGPPPHDTPNPYRFNGAAVF